MWVWWWHRRDGTIGWEFGAPRSVKAKQKPVLLSPTLGEKRCPCPPYAGTFISIYASIFFPIICYEEEAARDWELKDRFQVSPPLSIRCGLMATLLASPPFTYLMGKGLRRSWPPRMVFGAGPALPGLPHCHQRGQAAQGARLPPGDRRSSLTHASHTLPASASSTSYAPLR